jgi:methylmalonyl-CoA/ethylmalonyl-CoA epimerase
LPEFRIHHIGYATESIKQTLAKLREVGFQPVSAQIHDSAHDVELMLVEKNGYTFELIQPAGDHSPVSNILKKTGGATAYHICYATPNILKGIAEFQAMGYKLLTEPTPAPLFSGRMICFLWHLEVGLIELIEEGR